MKTIRIGFMLLTAILFAPPAQAGTFTLELAGSLVELQGTKLVPVAMSAIVSKKIIALYYAAYWSPPCRAFTPELAKEYADLSAKYPDFQLVFVSADKDAADMTEHMVWGKMTWPALAFDKMAGAKTVGAFAPPSIPCLIVLDSNGKQLLGKAAGRGWAPPQQVLEELKALLAKKS